MRLTGSRGHRPVLNEKTKPPARKSAAARGVQRDLTERGDENLLDPLVGRIYELERVQQGCAGARNNAVLIGEPGVGKTAIVEGLAQKIVYGDVPHFLADKRIISPSTSR